jgi:zinc/manganese transport system substrate-binding protein
MVLTTFLPITLFTRAVAGDCAEVRALIPAASGPHDFQARPGDLRALAQARVLVINGLGMETFLATLVSSAENPRLQVIDSSRGMATLAATAAASGHPDGEGDHERDHDHQHGQANPHIWLDPLRAVKQVSTIRDGLIRADPGCAAGYRRHAAAYIASLRQLDRQLSGQLQPFRGRTFVAFHAVAPYFAERYGLRVLNLVASPELNPTPADLQRVAAQVKRSQLRALLSEPQQADNSFQALARDLGVRIAVFDPLETGSEAAAADPDTYLRVMRRNGAALRQAFGP